MKKINLRADIFIHKYNYFFIELKLEIASAILALKYENTTIQ